MPDKLHPHHDRIGWNGLHNGCYVKGVGGNVEDITFDIELDIESATTPDQSTVCHGAGYMQHVARLIRNIHLGVWIRF